MPSNYIDLSGSTFAVTPDGKYCFNLKFSVHGNVGTSQECFPITKDTYADRVLCMTRAIMSAYSAYVAGTGASSVVGPKQQTIYDEIVQQFLPTIKNWDLCDAEKFVYTYLSHVDNILLKDSQMSETLNQLGQSLHVALKDNGCLKSTSGSSSNDQLAWYIWMLIALGVVVVSVAVWYGWKRYRSNQPQPHKSSSASHSTSRRRTR